MSVDAYEKLAHALDLLPEGFPRTASGVELQILKKIFSPEEALVASNMTCTSETADAIAERSNLSQEEIETRLTVMVDKGIIWGSTKRAGVKRFRLAPFVVGFYEEQWDIMDHELAHLCEQYWSEGGAEGIMRYEPALHRVVPAQGTVKTEFILPYDDIKPLILQANFFELRDCICRKQQDLMGTRKCDFPLDVCLIFSLKENRWDHTALLKKKPLMCLTKLKK